MIEYKIRLLKINNTRSIECLSFDTMLEFAEKLRETIAIAERDSKYITFCNDVEDFLCNVGESASSRFLEDEIPVVGIDVDNKIMSLDELEDWTVGC